MTPDAKPFETHELPNEEIIALNVERALVCDSPILATLVQRLYATARLAFSPPSGEQGPTDATIADRLLLTSVAKFMEGEGRDGGGYSNETRAEFQKSADDLRALSSRLAASRAGAAGTGEPVSVYLDIWWKGERIGHIRADDVSPASRLSDSGPDETEARRAIFDVFKSQPLIATVHPDNHLHALAWHVWTAIKDLRARHAASPTLTEKRDAD